MAGSQRNSVSLSTFVLGILLTATSSAALIFGVLWATSRPGGAPREAAKTDAVQVGLAKPAPGDTPPPAATSAADETDSRTLQAIREAAIIAAKTDPGLLDQAMAWASRADAVNLRERNVPLTFLVLLLNPRNVDREAADLTRAFRFHNSPISVVRIVEDFTRNRPENHPNLLSTKSIRHLSCRRAGSQARGVLSVEEPGVLSAQIHYVAAQDADGWRVIEFSLPEWEARTVLQDGNWRASGRGVLPSKIRLPSTHAAPARKESANRFLIAIGSNEANDVAAPASAQSAFARLSGSVGTDDDTTGFEALVEKIRPKVTEFAASRKIDPSNVELVLWLDRDVPVGSLHGMMRPAEGIGIREFLLATEIELGDDDRQWIPARGEFRIGMPSQEEIPEIQLDLEQNLELQKKAIQNPDAGATGTPVREFMEEGRRDTFEVAFRTQNEPETKPADSGPPPLRLRIRATNDGNISSIHIAGRPLRVTGDGRHFAELQQSLRTFVAAEAIHDLVIEVDADPQLKCQHFISVLSACGHKMQESPRTLVPFAKAFRLASPKALPAN